MSFARNSLLYFDEFATRKKSGKRRIFNLDLHISVIEDLKRGMEFSDVDLVSWSISNANQHTRKVLKVPDPVKVINHKNWQSLDIDLIESFNNRYGKFLSSFDGFIVTHTPSFAELFEKFQKPMLVVSSTRYEAPYTDKPESWNNLNKFLLNGVHSGQIKLYSNNRGDQDYLDFHLGIKPTYTPSLCDYTDYRWSPNQGTSIIMARSIELCEAISQATSFESIPYRKFFGKRYQWEDFNRVKEVFYIPHNISTMTLFEFATSGIPVAIPSKELLKKLMTISDSILAELSYFQINKLDVSGLSKLDPNNYASEYFYDWWLNRADFYDFELMPNVRVIDSLKDLRIPSKTINYDVINERNKRIAIERKSMISDFLDLL
jgi:hypothetical protein